MRIICENIEKGYVIAALNTTERMETLEVMAREMVARGFVKESYVQAIKDREVVFPTGLPMEAFGVAIPHTDSIHVERKAVMVGIPEQAIDFIMMGDDTEIVPVEMLFMLAILKQEEQVVMLSNLIEFCQNTEILNTLKEAQDILAMEKIMEEMMP